MQLYHIPPVFQKLCFRMVLEKIYRIGQQYVTWREPDSNMISKKGFPKEVNWLIASNQRRGWGWEGEEEYMWSGSNRVSSRSERIRLLGQREGAGERRKTDGKKWERSRSSKDSWVILKGYGLHMEQYGTLEASEGFWRRGYNDEICL